MSTKMTPENLEEIWLAISQAITELLGEVYENSSFLIPGLEYRINIGVDDFFMEFRNRLFAYYQREHGLFRNGRTLQEHQELKAKVTAQ